MLKSPSLFFSYLPSPPSSFHLKRRELFTNAPVSKWFQRIEEAATRSLRLMKPGGKHKNKPQT